MVAFGDPRLPDPFEVKCEGDEASLERHGWCETDGIHERIPLKVLPESDRKRLAEADPRRTYWLYSAYFKGDRHRVPTARFKVEDKRWKDLPVLGASLTSGQKQAGWTRPAFIERRHEAFRAYYAFVPKGKSTLE